MDELIKRHPEVLGEKGFPEFGSSPVEAHFPAKFPIACLSATSTLSFEETEAGAVLRNPRAELECRAYQLSDLLLGKTAEWLREGRIPDGEAPIPYIFALFSGMTRAHYTYPDPEKDPVEHSVLEGVTLYLPEKKVILAIETKEKHGEIADVMGERGYLGEPNRKAPGEP